MGFGDTNSKSNATDSRVAADGSANVAHTLGVIFNSGGRKTDFVSLAIVLGGLCVAGWLLWRLFGKKP